MRATLTLNFLPPTLNEIIRDAEPDENGRIAYRKRKHDYTRDCAIAALALPPFPGKVWLHFLWKIATLDRDPADNLQSAAKFVLDGLVQAGILQDDNASIIQNPIVIDWQLARKEGLVLTISDSPLYKLTLIEEPRYVDL